VDGQNIPLRSQTLSVLECLLRSNGALVTKEALMTEVWPTTAVTDDSLVQCIREIRAAIGDTSHKTLQTLNRRGYRLVVGETEVGQAANAASQVSVALPTRPAHDYVPRSSLAVMPFSSELDDERSNRLALAFAGDLIAELGRQSMIRITSRVSSFSLRKQRLSSKEICRHLGVRYLVNGEVQFGDDDIAWSLELVEGASDSIAWSEKKRIKFSDHLRETEALMWRIAGTIQNSLLISVLNRTKTDPSGSLSAYELCARSAEVEIRGTPESAIEAQRLALEAVTRYPDYAYAWTRYTNSTVWDSIYAFTGQWTDARAGEMLALIQRSIELNPSHAFAHSLRAHILCENSLFREALTTSQYAVELAPGYSEVLHYHAMILFWCGNLEETINVAASAQEVAGSRNVRYVSSTGRALYFLGREREGLDILRECVTLFPGLNWGRMALIVALKETGETEEAAAHYEQLLARTMNFDAKFFGRRWTAIPTIRDRYLKAFTALGMR
jgi:DNA-binding winged helix-turn-helix (wHTH) protein/tetratricopeptide (TPR) repeat protein